MHSVCTCTYTGVHTCTHYMYLYIHFCSYMHSVCTFTFIHAQCLYVHNAHTLLFIHAQCMYMGFIHAQYMYMFVHMCSNMRSRCIRVCFHPRKFPRARVSTKEALPRTSYLEVALPRENAGSGRAREKRVGCFSWNTAGEERF